MKNSKNQSSAFSFKNLLILVVALNAIILVFILWVIFSPISSRFAEIQLKSAQHDTYLEHKISCLEGKMDGKSESEIPSCEDAKEYEKQHGYSK